MSASARPIDRDDAWPDGAGDVPSRRPPVMVVGRRGVGPPVKMSVPELTFSAPPPK